MKIKAIVTATIVIAAIASLSVAWAGGDAAAGEAVYQRVCKMCHGSGMMGAPKLGDKAAWDGRIKQGFDTLKQHAINGYKKMPPRGNCKSCSDQDIADAVAYVVSKAK